MGPGSHSCKLNPWCHFILDDVMWWDCDCVAWRGVNWCLWISWYSALLFIYCTLYIGNLWSAVKRPISSLVPVVHNVTVWWLVGWFLLEVAFNPFVLLYRVPLWVFHFLLWGSCVSMYSIFFLISPHSHQRCFTFQQTLIPKKTQVWVLAEKKKELFFFSLRPTAV